MAASSKSSQTAKNVVLALLAFWSLVSLIIIVVWGTSPDLKSSAVCRAELQEVTEKMEGAKVVWSKNKVALEELLEEARQDQDRQRVQNLLLLGRLNATNATLEESRQENAVLNGNITVLLESVQQLRQTEVNLTAQIALQEEHMEALQQNLTEAGHLTESCSSLRAAAESQTRACESRQQYLHKQLLKCKDVDSEAPQETQLQDSSSSSSPLSAPLFLLVCSALHLMTCKYRKTPSAPEHMTYFTKN
ncbi:uncharacterized protein LOC116377523 [Anarrhichthys ocellatus]|uniref:uncharacterized protein LOC116377523 n=1 Tax=Anarrhichthys ocellatus TaxID=433405 RepID=UPI0012EE211F|nr:uncharacterized protein LOC116377523 [Anarrhichthys ocellatus]